MTAATSAPVVKSFYRVALPNFAVPAVICATCIPEIRRDYPGDYVLTPLAPHEHLNRCDWCVVKEAQAAQLGRARLMLGTRQVRVLSRERIEIESSVRGRAHTVFHVDGTWRCTCPAFAHRQRRGAVTCKHVDFVRMLLGTLRQETES